MFSKNRSSDLTFPCLLSSLFPFVHQHRFVLGHYPMWIFVALIKSTFYLVPKCIVQYDDDNTNNHSSGILTISDINKETRRGLSRRASVYGHPFISVHSNSKQIQFQLDTTIPLTAISTNVVHRPVFRPTSLKMTMKRKSGHMMDSTHSSVVHREPFPL